MCPGIVFLWQVHNCPVGFLDTLLKAELLPKKFEFSEFSGLLPSLESPTPSVASKSVTFSVTRGVDGDPFLLSLGVPSFRRRKLLYRRLSWVLIHITNIMYQLTMTQLWFINGQGDIILIDLYRQNPTELCICKLFSHTNYYRSQSCAINSVYCTTKYVWKLPKSYRSPLNCLSLFTSGNSPNLAKTSLPWVSFLV